MQKTPTTKKKKDNKKMVNVQVDDRYFTQQETQVTNKPVN
jgi:hypothetical protein